MSDFNDKNGFSADEIQWKTIEELIREIREEKEAAGVLPDDDGNDPAAAERESDAAAEPEPEAAGEPEEESEGDGQGYYMDLDWDRVDEMSGRKLEESSLNWELPKDEEMTAQPVIAGQEPDSEDASPADKPAENIAPAEKDVTLQEQAEITAEEADAASEAKSAEVQKAAEEDSAAEPELPEAQVPEVAAAKAKATEESAEAPSDENPADTAASAEKAVTLQEQAEQVAEESDAVLETEPADAKKKEPSEETDAALETESSAQTAESETKEKAAEPEKSGEAKAGLPPAAKKEEKTAKTGRAAAKEEKKEKPKRRRGVHPVSVIITAALLAALFLGVFHIAYPVDFNNLGGAHSWLSGSTIKFVNNWLDEGPQELHFTNYHDTYSVETKNHADRNAYVSYPTGTTLFVYGAAKATGRQNIDISFLKHFQMTWYLVEAILLAWFVMLLAGGSGYRSESGKVVLGFMTGAIWILMPVNLWYLSNVYFADQAVILWVMLFLPVEYLIRVKEKGGWINGEDIHALSRAENRKRLRDGHAPLLLLVLRLIIIYTGMLVDYYFWILVFMAFITEFIGDLLNKRGFGRAVFRSLGYVIPVAAALLTFRWQVSEVENWKDLLMERFIFRTTDDIAGLEEVRGFFRSAFTADSEEMMQWMIYYNLVILVLSIVYILFHRGPARLFKSSQCSILVTAFGAIVFHVFLLKQHSGVHEFSQIKISWWIAMMPAVSAILLLKILAPENREGKSRNPNLSWLMLLFMLSFSATLYITQIPSVDRAYYQFRNQQESYPIEEAIRDYTGYRDVCFSFTYEIPDNPPQKLAVSGKKVYHIQSLDEINEMFPDLWMDNARLLMVIEKASDELTPEQNDVIYAIFDPEAVVVENSSCTIFEIPDWSGMV